MGRELGGAGVGGPYPVRLPGRHLGGTTGGPDPGQPRQARNLHAEGPYRTGAADPRDYRARRPADVLGRLVRVLCRSGHRARHPAGGSAGGSLSGEAHSRLVRHNPESHRAGQPVRKRCRAPERLATAQGRGCAAPGSLGNTYEAPEAPLRVPSLHPPANHPLDPWPFIDAVRASAFAVLEAAMLLEVGLGRDDPEYRDEVEDFPDLEDRIRLAIVVARSALFCAQTEARVKNRLYGRTDNDPDTCWPQGVHKELQRHKRALTSHRALQIRRWRFPSML